MPRGRFESRRLETPFDHVTDLLHLSSLKFRFSHSGELMWQACSAVRTCTRTEYQKYHIADIFHPPRCDVQSLFFSDEDSVTH